MLCERAGVLCHLGWDADDGRGVGVDDDGVWVWMTNLEAQS